MKAEDLINWGELSRILTGSRLNIRKNRIPKRYEPFINDLKSAITNELSKLPDTAKAGWQNKTESTDTVD